MVSRSIRASRPEFILGCEDGASEGRDDWVTGWTKLGVPLKNSLLLHVDMKDISGGRILYVFYHGKCCYFRVLGCF